VVSLDPLAAWVVLWVVAAFTPWARMGGATENSSAMVSNGKYFFITMLLSLAVDSLNLTIR
jgi:hypothetical protein